MRLKEKKILPKFAALLKKFSAQGAKKVDYGILYLKIETDGSIRLPHIKHLSHLLQEGGIYFLFIHQSVIPFIHQAFNKCVNPNI